MERPTMDHNEALRSQACERYLLGELSPVQRDAYEEHYFSCAECAAQLRSAAEFISASREVFAGSPAPRTILTPARIGWFAGLKPAFALPVFALFLLVIGYQNFVTIPRYKQAASPHVLPMHSLIAGNSRGGEGLNFTSASNEPLGLYVDVPTDPAHSTYLLRLEDPAGRSSLLRSVSAQDAQKTQVIVVNPGTTAGKYTIVISGLASATADASSAEEITRLQFVIELTR
jgi:hypothetical protein